jgi:ZIP family zinc transporter
VLRPRRPARLATWALGIGPAVLAVALVGVFLALDPIARLRDVAPVEAVAFERTTLTDGAIELLVRNDGPAPVTIAQVIVDDAYREHDIDGRHLGRLQTARITIPYPWETGMPLTIVLVTATGDIAEHHIEAAALTPTPETSTLGVYALLGLYVGVIPVAIGLLWLPALRRASPAWLAFVLAFSIGLLTFLLVDTIVEGLTFAGAVAAALDGEVLFAMSALLAAVGLGALGDALRRRSGGTGRTGLALAYLVAAGIGLHNMGEGLAIGGALAAGELSLGTTLVVGFAIHNTTEGLAIVAPLRVHEQSPGLWDLIGVAAVAGGPTMVGAVVGGFIVRPALSAIAFGIAAGTIAQVIWTVGRDGAERGTLTSGAGALGLSAGVLFMYVTGVFAM